MEFKPCNGKCTEEGTHCEGCGRSQAEVADLRKLVSGLVDYARTMEYENYEDFADGVAGSIKYLMGEGHGNAETAKGSDA